MHRLSLLLLVGVASEASAQSVPRPPSPKEGTSAVQQLSWMAGCWRRQTTSGLVADEQWMAPRAGFALGSMRTVRGDSMVVEYHQLRIFQRGGHAVYHAAPSGQVPAEFEAKATSDSMVVFENLTHDYPQRVIYRKHGADSLLARIEGEMNGQSRAVDFPSKRVPCP